MKLLFYILLFCSATASLLSQGKERFQIDTQKGAAIVRNFDLLANCSSKYTASVSVEKNKITITQIDISSQKEKCNCLIDLDITVNQLSAGDYKILVLREELKKYGYSKDTVFQVYSTDIKIKSNGNRLQSAFSVDQSDCKNQQQKHSNSKSSENSVAAYPNASSSTISLNFELQKDGDVTIQLFNYLGKQVTSFQRNNLSAGSNTVSISAKDLQPGMYIGKLITSSGRISTFRLTWSK